MLSSFIPHDERIVTIEDAAELQLHQDHVLRLESRPANIEGKGAVEIRDLVKNSLRMRPDRIVVGEVRDSSALDMLQAMNTGHDGSLCTVHSNGPRDTLARIETMVLMAGMDLPIRAIREQVASAVDLIVHQSRLKDGSRRITHVTEVERMEGDVITLQDVFIYDHSAGLRRERQDPRPAAGDRAAPQVHREARPRQRARRPDAVRDGRCLTRDHRPRTRVPRPLLALAAWVVVGVTLSSSPALAAEGTIDHIETRGGKVQVLYSLPGAGDATPDLATIGLTLDGKPPRGERRAGHRRRPRPSAVPRSWPSTSATA